MLRLIRKITSSSVVKCFDIEDTKFFIDKRRLKSCRFCGSEQVLCQFLADAAEYVKIQMLTAKYDY